MAESINTFYKITLEKITSIVLVFYGSKTI